MSRINFLSLMGKGLAATQLAPIQSLERLATTPKTKVAHKISYIIFGEWPLLGERLKSATKPDVWFPPLLSDQINAVIRLMSQIKHLAGGDQIRVSSEGLEVITTQDPNQLYNKLRQINPNFENHGSIEDPKISYSIAGAEYGGISIRKAKPEYVSKYAEEISGNFLSDWWEWHGEHMVHAGQSSIDLDGINKMKESGIDTQQVEAEMKRQQEWEYKQQEQDRQKEDMQDRLSELGSELDYIQAIDRALYGPNN